jgi:hypothetical protein
LSVTLHRAFQEFQRSPAIPPLRSKDLKHLAFVIYRTPEIMRLSIDPDEYLVQVPTPVRIRPMMMASFPDRGRKHRTEPVPPVPGLISRQSSTPRVPISRISDSALSSSQFGASMTPA